MGLMCYPCRRLLIHHLVMIYAVAICTDLDQEDASSFFFFLLIHGLGRELFVFPSFEPGKNLESMNGIVYDILFHSPYLAKVQS